MLRGPARRECTEKPLLFIGVSTGPHKVERRTTVRNTWMKYPELRRDRCLDARFFIGSKGLDKNTSDSLQEEARTNGDIVFLPVEDTYAHLPNKTMQMFKWVAENNDAHMVMKVDDDTWPHMGSLLQTINEQTDRSKYTYMGSFLWHHPVLHYGKWSESYGFRSSFYPPFADGPGYLLSGDLVKQIAHIYYGPGQGDHIILNNEDANVGLAVLQMPMPQRSMVKYVEVQATQWGCAEGDVLSMQLSEDTMRCMWSLVEAGKSDICCIR